VVLNNISTIWILIKKNNTLVYLVISLVVFSSLLFISLSQENRSLAYNASSTEILHPNGVNTTLLYQNNSIQIEYPASWHKKEIGGIPKDNVTDIVRFYPPKDTSFAEITISSDSGINNQSLASYLSDIIASEQQDSKDFKVIDSNTISTLSGNPAYLLVSSYTDASTSYKTLETGTMIDNKVYFITYDVKTPYYSTYLPYVKEMINSFKLLSRT
jgi:hypothetical protein